MTLQNKVESRPIGGDEARAPRASSLPAALLLAALAGAICKQGGFYPAAQYYLGALIVAATVLSAVAAARLAVAERGIRGYLGWPGSAAPAALAGWTLLDAGLHGSVGSGLRLALLIIAVVAVIADCYWLDGASIEFLLGGLVLVGGAVGLLGWFGPLCHRTAFALSGQGVWRASATLGYPNAAAALLAMLGLAGLALRCRRTPSAGWQFDGAVLTATLLGLAATLSRGGVLALAAGAVALLAALGWRPVLAAGWSPVLGCAIALAGLLPSLPVNAHSAFGLASLALVAGLTVGALPREFGSRIHRYRWLIMLAEVTAVGLLSLPGRLALDTLGQGRLSASNADRIAAWHAVWHQIGLHPLAGSGPGLRQLRWAGPDGSLRIFNYAHDEYLQLFAELGVLGLIALGCCLVVLVRMLLRWRPERPADRPLWAAALAALAALAVSALFDFTGHFSAIPLTAAALAGCAGSVHRLGSSKRNSTTMKGNPA